MTGFYLFWASCFHEPNGKYKVICRQLALMLVCISRGLRPINPAFQKNFFSGTEAALEITGTHGRPNVKVESAPAAIYPLSAACRCASHPPSNPSVLPPEIGTQSAMAGFSRV